jgi:hypothetical protein
MPGESPVTGFDYFPQRIKGRRSNFVELAFVSSIRKASGNDAALFEAEIVAPARGGRTDDDVIQQVELQDSAGLENPPSEPHIGLGRGGVTRRVIVHQNEN